LRRRLGREEPDVPLWRDRDEIEGGRGWWNQIAEALDAARVMVLVVTPAALRSDVVRREWRYARQRGVRVYPVAVPDAPIDYATLPGWMAKAHFYDLDHEWDKFVRHLKD